MKEESAYVIDSGDHWTLRLNGMQVIQCCFDYQIALRLWKESQADAPDTSACVTISGDFKLTMGGKMYCLHTTDEEDPCALAIVLSLFLKKVQSATVDKSGILDIWFEDGIVMSVDPASRYEAWDITCPEGIIVSQPGGGAAFV